MSSQLDKMRNGELYDFSRPEILDSLHEARRKNRIFNSTSMEDETVYRKALSDLIPGAHPTVKIVPPFFCDHGHRIDLAEGVFINTGCTMLDCGGITIGARTLVGPSCNFYTPEHPIDYIQRRKPVETGKAISIGEDCWICGNVTICPGVKIGDRCIIGAGSVVVHDIPDDSLAAGNPATVKRSLR